MTEPVGTLAVKGEKNTVSVQTESQQGNYKMQTFCVVVHIAASRGN